MHDDKIDAGIALAVRQAIVDWNRRHQPQPLDIDKHQEGALAEFILGRMALVSAVRASDDDPCLVSVEHEPHGRCMGNPPEIVQVAACLDDDAAVLVGDEQPPEITENMNRAAEMLLALALKSPSPSARTTFKPEDFDAAYELAGKTGRIEDWKTAAEIAMLTRSVRTQ